MPILQYNRLGAVAYAKRWALSRNPKYYDFSDIGGDCTNFISQCVFAGSGIMNYSPALGWYFVNINRRSPSWTGVEFLYEFLVHNKGAGPFAQPCDISEVQPGDIIQLGKSSGDFYHSLLVTQITDGTIYISTHTYDAYLRPLSAYTYERYRCVHIQGVRY